jgi:DeoR/GlpR family transcriptional regulator of sugar metabolism
MVKKLIFLVSIIMLGYIIFYDIKIGTLQQPTQIAPVSSEQQTHTSTKKKNEQHVTIPYKEIEIKSGDTLLTIIEQLHTNQKTPPIKQITNDFKLLNHSTSPTKLIIGKTYKFPIYKQ